MNHNQLIGVTSAVAATVVFAGAAMAQNLSKSEEGRAALGQCYSACMDGAERSSIAAHDRYVDLTRLLISDEFFLLTDELQASYLNLTTLATCDALQDHVIEMDACVAGCLDLEEVYGVRSSHAKGRLYHGWRGLRSSMQAAGLWNSWNDYPAYGTDDFQAACDRLVDAAAASGEAASLPAPFPVEAIRRREPAGASATPDGSRPSP